jgi:hypothetical protein
MAPQKSLNGSIPKISLKKCQKFLSKSSQCLFQSLKNLSMAQSLTWLTQSHVMADLRTDLMADLWLTQLLIQWAPNRNKGQHQYTTRN